MSSAHRHFICACGPLTQTFAQGGRRMGWMYSNRTLRAAARRAVCLVAGALLLGYGATAARCQTPEQFYKGRQLTMLVFTGAGSTYDIYARLLVRHMGKHIPGNPTFIVQNMIGAGGFKLVDYLYRIAPADGS